MRQDNKDAVDKRQRIIEWQDPRAVREQADGLSVLDSMRAIRDGRLPPPPIARLIGFHYIAAEPGEIVIELRPEQSLENISGTLHEAAAGAMLDTAMSAAVGTLLPADKRTTTLDLTVSYLKPSRSNQDRFVPSVGSLISPNELHTRRARSAMEQAVWPLTLSVSSR
jgi:uncharacterized protein (TIGR00369 family)